MNTIPHAMQHVPFNQFAPWEHNVRRTGYDANITELAASISAHGLLQPLVAKQNGDGGFSVVAGRRRFLAMQQLVRDGEIAEDMPVACTLIEDTANDTEISLVENMMQLPMHPADKFEAFRTLADKGMQPADIAVRFGISEATVIKLLKLGRLSPEVMQAYRDEKIDYLQVQAFTLSDDPAEQNRVLTHILQQSWRAHPSAIKSELVKAEVAATDKRVRFVGLDFYEMCGGAVRRDLFDDENSGYIQDIALLDNLVENKVQSTIAELQVQGWKWITFVSDADWSFRQGFQQLPMEQREFTEAEQEILNPLAEKFAEFEDNGYDEEDEATVAEVTALDTKIQAMYDALACWPAQTKAVSGVLLSLDHNGTLKTDYGLVDKSDADAIAAIEIPEIVAKGASKEKPEHSSAFVKDLTSHRTAALRIELAKRPDIALATVVYSLALNTFYYGASPGNCTRIRGTQKELFNRGAEVAAVEALAVRHARIDRPDSPEELWDWCLARSQEELLEVLAVCVASTVDAVVVPHDRYTSGKDIAHSDQLARAVELDMRKWFRPDAANCFGRMSRTQILKAYLEVTGKEPTSELQSLKKKDLAIRAEREIGERWLPPLLRQPQTAEQDQKS